MAHADSISQAWERLNDAVYAIQALGQIISTTSHYSAWNGEDASSVFCYLADSLGRDRDAYEQAQAEKVSSTVSALEAANG